MSEISNGDLFNVLLAIRGDIGRLDEKAKSTADLLEKHDIHLGVLEANVNRQKGALRTITSIGAVLGVIGGWFAGHHGG